MPTQPVSNLAGDFWAHVWPTLCFVSAVAEPKVAQIRLKCITQCHTIRIYLIDAFNCHIYRKYISSSDK